MANVGEQLTQPETGWRRIEDTNISIKYDGEWTFYGNASFSGNSAHYNNTKDFVSFIFYGSKLRIISEYFDNRDTDNLIIIDDVEYNFNCYSSTKKSIVIAFEKLDLQKGCHTVKIANMNVGKYFLLDCIDIDEDGYMVYCDDNNKLYYDVTPIMTSNTTPAPYVVSVSSEHISSNYMGYTAFNGINESDSYGWAVNNGVHTGSIAINLNKKFNYMMLIPRYNLINQFPKNFDLEGGDDNNSYTIIKKFRNITSENNAINIFNIGNIYKYNYIRLNIFETIGSTDIGLSEIRYLLAVDTPFYLINDNGVYKNYDEETNSLVEVEDTSILNENSLNNTCIYDLNKVKDLIDLKSNGVKVISNKNFKSKIKSIKTTKQLFFANGDFSTRVANNIDYFKFNYDIPDGTIIKTVVSISSGNAWYTHIDGAWTQLDNIVPLKDYSELSSNGKIQWDTFLDEVLTKGINIQEVNTLDFNTLNSEKIRFAYAIQISDGNANAEAILKDLKWQFDSIGSYEQLNPKTDVNIKMTNNEISITPLKNIELMKINVGISSQVPQVFDTSGLMDKSTFKGKYEDSVKRADSIYVPDDVVLNSDYGIDINGNLGYRPRIPIPNEITSYIFPMLTKDIQQSLSIESEGINYMVQCYAKQPDLTNVEEVFESYANPIVTNHSDNVETVEDNGTKTTQIKNNNIYKSTNNSETGFHEFAIDFPKYIYINSIEEVDNDE